MDINDLLKREQVALYRASMAASGPARLAHEAMASLCRSPLVEARSANLNATVASIGAVTAYESARWMDDGGREAASTWAPAKVSLADLKAISMASAPLTTLAIKGTS